MVEKLRLGLTGWPLDHSLSPQLHRAALSVCNYQGEYSLFPIPPLPQGAESFKDLLQQVRLGHINGLNVTIPHKQAVLRWMDELTPTALRIGAVNLIYTRQDQLVGDNTDAPAFLTDLYKQWGETFASNSSQQPCALLLGAGGASRAVSLALSQSGWHVTVAARRSVQSQDLVNDLGAMLTKDGMHPSLKSVLLDKPSLEQYLSTTGKRITLIINATPLGMLAVGKTLNPQSHDSSPWPAGLAFPPGAVVYDLVYNPPLTTFLRTAQQAGLRGSNGLGMLVEQAALSFERWVGIADHNPAHRTGRFLDPNSEIQISIRNAMRAVVGI